jgi:hypothetical protein
MIPEAGAVARTVVPIVTDCPRDTGFGDAVVGPMLNASGAGACTENVAA